MSICTTLLTKLESGRQPDRKMVSGQQIAASIRQLRSQYIAESRATSYWEINNGLCDDSARDVAHALGGETDALYSVENGNFTVDGDSLDGDPVRLADILATAV